MKAVKIVHNAEAIRLLAEPVRQEILWLLAAQPLNEAQLARKLSLTRPSTGHHLKVLRRAGLIRIKEVKVGAYGIQEKYYEPVAQLFIEDWQAIPLKLRRYFLYRHIERLRGMLSALQLITESGEIKISADQMRKLAHEVAEQLPVVGRAYEGREASENVEALLIEIYSKALDSVIHRPKWRPIFTSLKQKVLSKALAR